MNKSEPQREPKAESQPEAKANANIPPDSTPEVSERAYELYEERGRKDGRAVQDWEQAKQEIRKDEPPK